MHQRVDGLELFYNYNKGKDQDFERYSLFTHFLHDIANDSNGKNVHCKDIASHVLVPPANPCQEMRMVFDATADIPGDRVKEGEEDASEEVGVSEIDCGGEGGGGRWFGCCHDGRLDEIDGGGED